MAEKIKGITIQFGGDTTGLDKALKTINKQAYETQSQLRQVNKLLKFDGTNVTGVTQKQKLLQQSIESTKQKLDALKQAEKEAMELLASGKMSQSEFDKLQLEIAKTENSLKSLQSQSKAFGAELPTGVLIAQKSIAAFGDKCTELGNKLKGVSAAAAAILAGATVAANDVESGFNRVIKKTGATGEAAAGLETSFKNVASNTARSFDEVGGAMGALNARLGITGSELENATNQFLNFANVNEADVTSSVVAVTRAMGDANIPASELGSFLDQLTVASQKTGIDVTELADTMRLAGAPMRALGFTTDETVAIFAKWDQAGVNTTTAISGMKQAIKKWAEEGKNPREEFQKTLDTIKSAPSIADATGAAMEVFGARAGADMADAIYSGRFEIGELLNALKNAGGTLDATQSEIFTSTGRMKMAFNNLKLAGAELGKYIQDYLADVFTKLSEVLQGVTKWLSGLSDGAKKTVISVAAIVAALAPSLIIFGKVSKGVSDMILGLQGLIGVAGKAKAAISALTMFLSANPYVLAAAGAAILVGGIVALATANNRASDSQRELQESTQKARESMARVDEARLQSVSSANYEIERVQNLTNELHTLVGANGSVEEANRSRVNFILGQLNAALGTEYKMVDGIVQKYGDLSKGIVDVIEKKKAQLLLEANQESYKKAIQDQAAAEERKTQALAANVKAQKELEKAQTDYNDTVKSGNEQQMADASQVLARKRKVAQDTKQALDDTLNDENNYHSIIRKQEEATAALEQGNVKRAIELLQEKGNEVIKFTDLQNQKLDDQKKDLDDSLQTNQSYLQRLKDLKAQGNKDVTDDQIAWAQKRVDESQKEYDKMVDSVIQGSGRTKEAWAQMASDELSTYQMNLSTLPETTRDIISQAVGVTYDDKTATQAWQTLATSNKDGYLEKLSTLPGEQVGIVTQMSSVPLYDVSLTDAWKTLATNNRDAYNSMTANLPGDQQLAIASMAGIAMTDQSLKGAWQNLAVTNRDTFNQIMDSLPADEQIVISAMAGIPLSDSTVGNAFHDLASQSRDEFDGIVNQFPEDQRDSIRGIVAAIDAGQPQVQASAAQIADAQTKMNQSGQTYLWGEHAMQNLVDGISSMRDRVSNACTAVGDIIHSILGHTTPETGPLKNDDVWGSHLIENFANGILKAKPKAVKAAETVAQTLRDTLDGNKIAQGLNTAKINMKNWSTSGLLGNSAAATNFTNAPANTTNNYQIGSPVLKIENFNNNTNQDMKSLTLEFLQTADSYASRMTAARGLQYEY